MTKLKPVPQHHPQTQFTRLWSRIQKEKSNIAIALQQQKALVAEFNTGVLPEEIALNQQLLLETEHLLSFAKEPQLTTIERHHLQEWIASNLQLLKSRTFANSERHAAQLLKLEAKQAEAFADDGAPVKKPGRAAEDPDSYEYHKKPDDSHNEIADKNLLDPATFNPAAITKMFRQLARVFHPDLVQDHQQKLLRHEHMSRLLKAREQQDIFTIIQLHCAHHGLIEPDFTHEDLAQVNSLLQRQLQNIQQEKQAALYEDPLQGMIYQKFYRKNPQFQFLELKNHQQRIRQRCKDSCAIVAAISSVKTLKQVLRDTLR